MHYSKAVLGLMILIWIKGEFYNFSSKYNANLLLNKHLWNTPKSACHGDLISWGVGPSPLRSVISVGMTSGI